MKTQGFLGNEWEIECMGCAITSRTMLVPGGLIIKTENFCIHQDPLVPIPGFLVIASVRHIRSMTEMLPFEYEEFCSLFKTTHQAIKEVTTVEFLTVIQEERSKHFHLWFFPWTQKVIERYGSPSLTKIREIMADYRREPIDKAEWMELKKTIEKIRVVVE